VTVPARLVGFAVALGVVLVATLGVGKAVGPTNRAKDEKPAHGEEAMGEEHGGGPQGLAVANDDFRLVADTSGFAAGQEKTFRFRIVDHDGETVRDFDVEHEKKLHLIVVRRDLTRYQHVHPTEQADGSWTVPLRFADPGTYRVFADFTASGSERATLGTDLTVPGASTAETLPAPVDSVSVDGYDVAISSTAAEGEERALAFTVTRNGRPVTVEPYLGADGHLVVLRQGDLAYLHAHNEEGGEGGPIRFMVEYPSAGSYRLFLQFQTEGKVHTAAFTQEA
jgi:hypothetical protein